MGLPRRRIVWKYILRAALIGTLTQIGLVFGNLIAGAVVVETVFDWPGLGSFAVNSILQSDYNAVMSFTLFTGTVFILVNLLVDIAQAAAGPARPMSTLRRLLRDRSAMLGLGHRGAAGSGGGLRLAAGDLPAGCHQLRSGAPAAAARALTYFFGTDRMGADIYSRLLFGARLTHPDRVRRNLRAVLIGVPVGLVAGFYTNRFSEALMRVSDVFLAVPQIVLAIAIAQTLGPAIQNVILALSVTYWPFWARLVYAETRSLRNEVFIEAAVALGASPLRVMVLHVLPSISSSVIVRTTIGMGGTILTAAALGFLGLGPPPPSPEWGRMIAESREFLPQAWWYATAPGVAILLVVMGFNLLGDGLRDVLDPRLRRGAADGR